jgi:hypothetical protein
MMAMRDNKCTLRQISEAYNISVGMVWRILDVYGYGNDKKGKKNMKKEDLVKWESIKGACDTTVYEKEKKISIEFPDGRKINISFNEAFMVADSLTTIMTDERGMLQKKLKPAFKAQI